VLILLGALKHQDVLVAGVDVKRDTAARREAQERGGGPVHTVTIKAVDLDAFIKGLPWNLGLPIVRPGKIEVFQGKFH